jgi:arylsulfatase A-like enzyme
MGLRQAGLVGSLFGCGKNEQGLVETSAEAMALELKQTPAMANDGYCLSPILMGAVLGALVGAGEVVAGMLAPVSAVTRLYLLEAVVVYGACGALVGVGVALVSWIITRRAAPCAASAGALLGFFAFLMVAGYVNVRYLPQALARSSMLYTGLILVGAALVGVLVRRLLAGLPLARWAAARGTRRGLGVFLAAFGLAVVLGSVLPGGGRDVRVENPGAGLHRNVVFVVIDALRYDHLSQNGYARETTPCLDAWSREGVIFDNAQSHAPWTKPSTATLLTSLYPSTHGVNSMTSAVPPTVDLLPAMLRRYGYRTAVFTANHFVTPEFGFDRGTEFFYSSRPPRLQQLLLGHLLERLGAQVPLVNHAVGSLVEVEKAIGGRGAPEGGLSAEGLVRAFWNWSNSIGDDRFFAYLHFMEPHAPYDPPAPYDTFFLPEHLIGRPKVTNFPEYTGFLPFEPGRPMSPDSLTHMIALYDGGIRSADHWVGEMIAELKRRGLYKDTLILVTADHGEEFFDHGGWGHGQSLHEELIHVPLILSGPDLVPARGRRLPHLVRHVDLVPTILEVCGLPIPEGLAGQSLMPIVRAEEPAVPARMAYSEVDFGGRFARSLREGEHKVIRAQSGGIVRVLAYDLASDPGEMLDLGDRGDAWNAEMLTRLEEFHAVAARDAIAGISVTINEATRERLRAIGYLR